MQCNIQQSDRHIDSLSLNWFFTCVIFIINYLNFNDHLSLGYRYGKLVPADVPAGLVGSALDSGNNDPETHSIMSEWKFDSASIMRLQLNHETPRAEIVDNQIIFQYIMYLGSGGHDGHDH